jgi:phage terminase small subunit
MALSPKQKLFIKEYVKDKNGARAARVVGFSEKTAKEQASRLLTKVNVRAAVDAALAKQAEAADISAERIVKEISLVAFQKLNQGELKAISGNKLKALELLGKHFKIFTDVSEIKAELKVVSKQRVAELMDESEKEC